ncbi:acyl-CoA thioesterase [Streptomyces polygonati]|uniref:Acyl-CoA thioesterase n=1 Tax=Streptomyces polygonati TaxID=1617087 RepID=A0ABV8HK80_9ACTN
MTRTDGAGPPTERRRVEHVDTDASGVVHFSRYVSLMETVVLDHLEEQGAGLARFGELGADLAVVDLQVRYSRPAVYRDLLVGEAAVEHVSGARIRVAAVLLREAADGSRTELTSGTITFAAVSPATGAAVPIPPTIRQTLRGTPAHAPRHDSAADTAAGTARVPGAGTTGAAGGAAAR